MSSMQVIITDAFITNNQYNKPTIEYDKNTGKFQRLKFQIGVQKSKKDENSETGWTNKYVHFNCVISTEYLSNKFFKEFDKYKTNLISITNSNFDCEVEIIEKIKKNGDTYNTQAHLFSVLYVKDFSFKTIELNARKQNINEIENEERIDDDIPF